MTTRLVAFAIVAVLLASCSSSDTSANEQTTTAPVVSGRDLGDISSVPPLADEPIADEPVDPEALIQTQYDETLRVLSSWDSDKFEAPELILVSTDSSASTVSACEASVRGNAFFCELDNTVSIDVGYVDDFSRRSVNGQLRDGAVFSTVAHELGHAWMYWEGFKPKDAPTVEGTELFADCIAGAVIAAVYVDPEVAAPLLEQAQEDAYSVGSYNASDPGFHGTPSQRRQATLMGATKGRDACLAYLR